MEYVNKSELEYTKFYENMQFYFYSVVSFFLPILMGHPQYLVGTVVNALLIMSAQNLKGKKLLAVITLPALGALSRGMLFGPFTVYLLYMLPAIWVGNAVLVYGYKFLKFQKKANTVFSLIPSIIVKVAVIAGWAWLLIAFGAIPAAMLAAMSLIQIVTAVLGAFLAVGATEFAVKRLAKRF